jgi:hypothetical protein
MLLKAESLQAKSPSGRQLKSPAFENREDRGCLSWYSIGREDRLARPFPLTGVVRNRDRT